MGRQIRLLTGLSFVNLFGFNEFRHTKDGKKRRDYYLFGILGGFLGLMVVFYVCGICYGLICLGAGHLVPGLLVMCVSGIVFFFTLLKAGSVLFDRKAYERQIVLPVSVRSILVSRFLSMYLTDMFLGMAVLFPGMAMYGVMERPGFSFFLYGILASLFLPLLPMTLASVLGAAITGVTSRWRQKNVAAILLTFVIVCLVLVSSFGMSGMKENQIQEMFLEAATLLEERIGSAYPPALWVSEAMVSGRGGMLFLFLVVSAGTFAGFLGILQRFYERICVSLGTRKTRGDYRMKELRARSVGRSLVEREFRGYFASTVYVTNTLMGEVMMVVASIALLVVGKEKLEAVLGIPGILCRLMPLFLGFLPAMMPTTASSVSMEGKQWWILKTLPVSGREVIRSKVLLNLLVAAPFYLVAEVLVILALKPGWQDLLSLIFVPVLFLLFSASIGVAVNQKFPLLDWDSEIKVVKQSRAVSLVLLVNFAAFLVPGVVLAVCPGVSAGLIYLVFCGVLAAPVWILDRRGNRNLI